ncbi:Tape measure domain protein [Ketogulonicigenium vulgare]|uniref:Tape measure domain protein n=2 Tax=Ketogulonicigenium vulgare TaxID=92945 RepID=F9Y4L7_KETVW|nr:tail tape measure protein [Ketogulonicigenium vulgare]AEM40574.1 Tape measure domain protein [Ketogulonicigenium vulgare WSH-001]ALJ80756.1 tail tape measure protein [Ketogulonicigenium vulgare]AOZ54290.1 Tape measure domain protein [Ketogulonicigenium vulgare]
MASPSIIGNLRVNLGLDARQFQQGARGSTTQVNTLRSALGPLTTGLRGVGAAMRTAFQFAGFTSLVGLAVTLGQKFFDLVKVTGGIGQAFGYVRDIGIEAWGRVGTAVDVMGKGITAALKGMQSGFATMASHIVTGGVDFANRYIGIYRGAFEAVKAIWGQLPGAIGDLAYGAANAMIGGVEAMLNGVIGRVNSFIAGVNSALALIPDWMGGENARIGIIGEVEIERIQNPHAGAAQEAGAAAAGAFAAGFNSNTFDGSGVSAALAQTAADAAEAARTALADASAGFADVIAPMQSLEAIRDLFAEISGGGGGSASGAASAISEVTDATNDLSDAAKSGASLMSDTFLGLVTGTKSLKSALGDLALQIAKTFAQQGFAQLAAGGGLWGGIASGLGSLIGANANGTNNWRGGLTQINERGGEIVDLPSGTRIIPHDVSNRMADGMGRGSVRQINIDVTGARGNAEIMDMVRAGMAQAVATMDAMLPMRVNEIAANPRMG